jgi:hypothetical protein
MCFEIMLPWCRQVNWGNCGIPWLNCAVLCVKDCRKGQFWGLHYCLKNCAVYLVSPSGMTSHSKTAQFNWECICPLLTLLVCIGSYVISVMRFQILIMDMYHPVTLCLRTEVRIRALFSKSKGASGQNSLEDTGIAYWHGFWRMLWLIYF